MMTEEKKKKDLFKLVKIGTEQHQKAKIAAVLSGRSLKKYIEDLIDEEDKRKKQK